MTDQPDSKSQPDANGEAAAPGKAVAPPLSFRQKIMLVLAVGVTLMGLALWLLGVGAGAEDAAPRTTSNAMPSSSLNSTGSTDLPLRSLAPAGGSTETTADSDAADSESGGSLNWSPAVFRLGFSFFAGFCIAYALRAFLKVTLIVAGVVLVLLFGLQYAGVAEIDWSAIGGHFDSLSAWLSAQTESFGKFVTGYLPSGGSAAAGMVMGFKKK